MASNDQLPVQSSVAEGANQKTSDTTQSEQPAKQPSETPVVQETLETLQESIDSASAVDPLTLVEPDEPIEEDAFVLKKIDEVMEIPTSWNRLGDGEIWIDREQHLVAVGGYICLRAGMLEMFACPQRTREHESIVAVTVPSRIVHAALLAVGAKPGSPVQYDPEYKPATGPKVRVSLWWMEDDQLQKRAAQLMIRHIRSQKPMDQDWVFGGSGTWEDSDGRTIYMADGGELVCVSNFGSAMLDLPIESSAEAGSLMFEAIPESIPEMYTPVMLVLEPEISAESAVESDPSG